MSERVEVTASALALDTETATVGQTITEKQVTELPLNGRNFLQLLFLGAGAVETDGEQGDMRQGVGNAISIMGAATDVEQLHARRHRQHRHVARHTPAAVLSVDAIQEFKEQTSTYSAEYRLQLEPDQRRQQVGHQPAARVRPSTSSGTKGLDARNFFDPAGTEKPKLDQKQFGFVVGGPVWLPFYDGRNKTFFLVNYEGTRIERGSSAFYTVPTPEELAGHFSTTIIDPATGQPFDNNTIPTTRFSDLARPCRREVVPRAERRRAPGQLPGCANAASGRRISSRSASIRTSAGTARVFGRFTDTTFNNARQEA